MCENGEERERVKAAGGEIAQSDVDGKVGRGGVRGVRGWDLTWHGEVVQSDVDGKVGRRRWVRGCIY